MIQLESFFHANTTDPTAHQKPTNLTNTTNPADLTNLAGPTNLAADVNRPDSPTEAITVLTQSPQQT